RIERGWSFRGDAPERGSVGWIGAPITGGEGLATRKEIRPGVRVAAQRAVLETRSQRARQARTDDEAFLGQPDGLLEVAGPGQAAVLVVRGLVEGDDARHADGAAGLNGLQEAKVLAVHGE